MRSSLKSPSQGVRPPPLKPFPPYYPNALPRPPLVNPHDFYGRETGLFISEHLPTPVGIDIVGTVSALGSKISNFAVGDHIFGVGNVFDSDGTGTQEYCVLAAAYAAKLPSSLSPDEAATLPVNAMTMFFALFTPQGLGMPPPVPAVGAEFDYGAQSVVIIGGGSATGKFGIQLAKLAGVGTIVTIASKKSENELKSLGATHVIDRHASDEELEHSVRAVVGDTLIYSVDCVNGSQGGQTLGASILSNSQKGTLVVLVHRGTVDETRLSRAKREGGYEKKAVVAAQAMFPEEAAAFWRYLPGWVEDRKVRPTTWEVVEGFNVERVNAAFDTARDGGTVVKMHVHVAALG